MPIWWGGGRKQDQERLTALEKAVEGLVGGQRLIKLEWESVFDKMNRIMGRLNARIRKSEAVTGSEDDAEVGPKGLVPPGEHEVLERARRRYGVLPR